MRFYMFDRIQAVDRGRRLRATRRVDLSDGCLADHFSRRAVLPASFLVEAIAQAGGMLSFLNHDFAIEMVLMLVDGVRFGRPVTHGETLEIDVTMIYDHPYGATVSGEVRSAGDLVASVDRLVYAHDNLTDASQTMVNRRRFEYQGGTAAMLQELGR
jgi:3-hydroxyacyl-[acyl-carrier-protein] dehydratase